MARRIIRVAALGALATVLFAASAKGIGPLPYVTKTAGSRWAWISSSSGGSFIDWSPC
ncbi:MAG: hypothetical protein QOJ89_2810 [bacterium]|jgi:hypothetical protein